MFQIKPPLKLGMACLLAIGFAQASFAAGSDPILPLPRVQPPCGAACADFKAAIPISTPKPEYRSDLMGNGPCYAPQGFAFLRYTIGTDGKTRDITPVINIGHHRIADQAIESIKSWTFTPATQNGKPVAQMATYRIYLVPDMSRISGPCRMPLPFNMAEADRLIAAGKADEARAMLMKGLTVPQLAYFPRIEIFLRLFRLAMERKDYVEARHYAVMATINGDPPARPYALEFWTTRLNADLALGEMADAVFSFGNLKRYGVVAGVDQRFKEAFVKANDTPELLARAAIPDDPVAPVYWHALYRNTFKFAEGAGALDRFSLMCDTGMMEGQVSFTSQWRLPATWRNCILFVSGAPGATFGVIETKD